MEERTNGSNWSAATWVAIVLVIGIVAGGLLALFVPVPVGLSPPGTPPPPLWLVRAGVLLSTLSLVLLLALLFVYARTYRDTQAPYTLGLVVFLAVLLVESAVNSPLVFGAFGLGPGILGRFLAVGGLLMSAALSIFLYLSLQ